MATHARTVVPITHNPWASLAAQCQRDAAAIVDAATLRACAEGRTRLTGAIEALVMLYGELMANNARLNADMDSLRRRVTLMTSEVDILRAQGRRGNWLQRLLRMGNA
jgi:hypothetical protein